MRSNSNEMSTFAATLLTLGIMIIIGAIISAFEPKCSWSNCDREAMEDSKYCYLHGSSYGSYGNTTYKNKRKENYTSSTKTTSTSKTYTSSTKKYNSYNSYDEGYEDVYDNDDYDWDRYWSDDDYADGVDDAMEELEDGGW